TERPGRAPSLAPRWASRVDEARRAETPAGERAAINMPGVAPRRSAPSCQLTDAAKSPANATQSLSRWARTRCWRQARGLAGHLEASRVQPAAEGNYGIRVGRVGPQSQTSRLPPARRGRRHGRR